MNYYTLISLIEHDIMTHGLHPLINQLKEYIHQNQVYLRDELTEEDQFNLLKILFSYDISTTNLHHLIAIKQNIIALFRVLGAEPLLDHPEPFAAFSASYFIELIQLVNQLTALDESHERSKNLKKLQKIQTFNRVIRYENLLTVETFKSVINTVTTQIVGLNLANVTKPNLSFERAQYFFDTGQIIYIESDQEKSNLFGGFGTIQKGFDSANNPNPFFAIKKLKYQLPNAHDSVMDLKKVQRMTQKIIGLAKKEVRYHRLLGRDAHYFIDNEHYVNIIMPWFEGKFYHDMSYHEISSIPLDSRCRSLIHALEQVEIFHHHGCIHGDIKTPNFVFNRAQEKMHLIDFGSSRKNGLAKEYEYTQQYYPYFRAVSSNEAVAGQFEVDIYAMGLVVAELFIERVNKSGSHYSENEAAFLGAINLLIDMMLHIDRPKGVWSISRVKLLCQKLVEHYKYLDNELIKKIIQETLYDQQIKKFDLLTDNKFQPNSIANPEEAIDSLKKMLQETYAINIDFDTISQINCLSCNQAKGLIGIVNNLNEYQHLSLTSFKEALSRIAEKLPKIEEQGVIKKQVIKDSVINEESSNKAEELYQFTLKPSNFGFFYKKNRTPSQLPNDLLTGYQDTNLPIPSVFMQEVNNSLLFGAYLAYPDFFRRQHIQKVAQRLGKYLRFMKSPNVYYYNEPNEVTGQLTPFVTRPASDSQILSPSSVETLTTIEKLKCLISLFKKLNTFHQHARVQGEVHPNNILINKQLCELDFNDFSYARKITSLKFNKRYYKETWTRSSIFGPNVNYNRDIKSDMKGIVGIIDLLFFTKPKPPVQVPHNLAPAYKPEPKPSKPESTAKPSKQDEMPSNSSTINDPETFKDPFTFNETLEDASSNQDEMPSNSLTIDDPEIVPDPFLYIGSVEDIQIELTTDTSISEIQSITSAEPEIEAVETAQDKIIKQAILALSHEISNKDRKIPCTSARALQFCEVILAKANILQPNDINELASTILNAHTTLEDVLRLSI